MIMKLHTLTPHESRMCPIDFGVKRSTVKVMAHGYLKMVHRNNGCRFEFVGVGGGPVLLQQYFQYAFICCPYMLPLLFSRDFNSIIVPDYMCKMHMMCIYIAFYFHELRISANMAKIKCSGIKVKSGFQFV